ncbi:hypothetical protein DH2020_043086 [Rehmannia glutinosa]|uniref:Uncharacterized protein n=1 Tax=Rehmannia glutinosa TaxID=99300 RepID=A0ABR0UKQ7_REHGL
MDRRIRNGEGSSERSTLKGFPISIPRYTSERRKDVGVDFHASRSEIGRSDNTEMIEAHDEAWAEYVKAIIRRCICSSHEVQDLAFSNEWVNIFRNDRATEEHAESFTEAVNNALNGMSIPLEEPTEQFSNLFEEFDDKNDSNYVSQPENTPQKLAFAKKSSSHKHKQTDTSDPMVNLTGTFYHNTDARLAKTTRRINNEYDIFTARNEVLGAVGTMQGLSL